MVIRRTALTTISYGDKDDKNENVVEQGKDGMMKKNKGK